MSIESMIKSAAAITGISAILMGGPLTAQNPNDQSVSPVQQESKILNDSSAQKFIDYAKGIKGQLPEKLRTEDWGLYSYFDGQDLGVLFNGKKFSYTVRVLPNNEFYFSHENYDVPLTEAQKNFGILGFQKDYFAKSDSGRVYDYRSYPVLKKDSNVSMHFEFKKPTTEQLTVYQREFDAGLVELMKVVQDCLKK